MSDTSDLIERLSAAAVEVRALITDAHAAVKDLRVTMKEYRDLVKGADVQKRIDDTVCEQLEKLGEVTKAQMDVSVAKVSAEFDKLAKLFLEGKNGGPPLQELAMATISSPCPACGKGSGRQGAADGTDTVPADGDFSVCGGCGSISVFTDGGTRRRRPTGAELTDALNNPEVTLAYATVNNRLDGG